MKKAVKGRRPQSRGDDKVRDDILGRMLKRPPDPRRQAQKAKRAAPESKRPS